MVMPIAEAVLQQLICTGLADSRDDSETADAPEDDSGTPSRRTRPVLSLPLDLSHVGVALRSRLGERRRPGEETAGAALSQ